MGVLLPFKEFEGLLNQQLSNVQKVKKAVLRDGCFEKWLL